MKSTLMSKKTFYALISSLLVLSLMFGCSKGSSESSEAEAPKERVYDIQNPNPDYENLSKEERHQKLVDALDEKTEGTITSLPILDDYEIVYAYIEYDTNIHTHADTSEIKQVHVEYGKVDSYDLTQGESDILKDFNRNNRRLWLYGPYESSIDPVILTLDYDNPILRRHLDPMSYNYEITIETILDDHPLLMFKQLIALSDNRHNYHIYEWQAIDEHRFRLAIKEGSEADDTIDAEAFITQTFE